MTEFSTNLHCQYFPLCSGCEFQGNVAHPPIYSTLISFFNQVAPQLTFPLRVKEVTGWRMRSKLAVRGSAIHPQIGLFKKGSHAVVSIPTCPLHHPSINRAYAQIEKALIAHKIEPYQEEAGRGLLRYLQFVVERKTGMVQLTLVVTRKDPSLEAIVKQLYTSGGFHSIWLNLQPIQTNKIFGDEWVLCAGDPYLWEQLDETVCAFHPACFGQAHLSLYDEVLRKIRQWAPQQQKILELYAGVGTIGLNLVKQSKTVTCTEINPFATECFQVSCQRLPQEQQGKISLQVLSAENSLPFLDQHQVLIVDPPRKGLEPKVLEAICQTDHLTDLIYLSCGPLSFQRDCEQLLAHDWKIENAEGYLFFPGNDHVEVLCHFRKKSG